MTSPAFIFDIGNVMIDFDLPRLLLELTGGDQARAEVLRTDYLNDLLIGVETGRVTPEAYLEQAIHPHRPDWTLADLTQAWADVFTINTTGRRLFLDLKARGFPVYVLSNLAAFNATAIRGKFPGFLEASTHNFLSFELGLHKPDARIYQAVCDRTGIPPAQCMFFDDHEPNVTSASAFGMHALQFAAGNIDTIRAAIEGFTRKTAER